MCQQAREIVVYVGCQRVDMIKLLRLQRGTLDLSTFKRGRTQPAHTWHVVQCSIDRVSLDMGTILKSQARAEAEHLFGKKYTRSLLAQCLQDLAVISPDELCLEVML